MKAIITGMNGTVAPALARRLRAHGHAVTAWDRAEVPIDDPAACRAFLDREAPDWFFHVATGSPAWAETVAALCAERDVGFLFTGSASVFSGKRPGPHAVDAPPDATDEYGRYKIECERRVMAANPRALVARIGWQIGTGPGTNTMLVYLARAAERGPIEASTRWLPACSFLDDTAEAIHRLVAEHPPGLYQLDGNRDSTMYDIARALARLYGHSWEVVPAGEPALDHRMIDERVTVAPITARF